MAKSISDTAKDRLANLKKTGGVPPNPEKRPPTSTADTMKLRAQEKKKVRKVLEEE